jgi:T5SS/PEP-CTERM-associated repeat protein
MNVGHGGAGTLSILDGGRVDNGNSFVGRFTGSVGHVTVDGAGSLWLIAGALRVGGNASAPGGEGHVDIAGGTATVTGQLKIWNTTNTVVNLAGGTLNVASLDTTGNPARFNWTGGTLNITTGFSLGAGGPFGSSLTLDGSRILSSPGAAYINNGDQLTVAGGTLSVANLLTNGAFSMSAGSVTTDQLTAGNSGSPAEGGGVGTISISGGTFTTGPVYLGSASGGSGNLTVSGAGTLECSKLAANDLVVNGGAVIVSDPDSPSGEYPALYRSVAAGYYRNGAITVNAGTLTAPNLKLGIAAGMTGTYTQSGGAVNVDVLGVGNDGTLGGGAGIGMASLSGGTLSAGSVFLGSTVGGSGHLTVSGTGTLECEKLSANDLIVNGGSVTVEDPNPPGRLDPVLYRSLVGGHLRDGAIIVTAGTVTTPNVKLGATAGKTGTYTQTGGSLVAGVLGVGNDGTLTGGAGIGNATISGGSVQAGSFLVGSTTGGTGKLHWSGGTLTGQSLMMAGNAELGVDLSGTTPGSGYAQLQLTAGVDLTGTLAIARTKGFEPALGDSFVIISCNTLTGAFDRVTGMAAGPGKVFRVQYNANNVTLVVGPPAPGDFDEDGDVDGSDYVTLDACAAGAALSYAIGCPLLRDGSGHVAADFDADADVDLYDFSIYQRCYSDTDVPADPACAP